MKMYLQSLAELGDEGTVDGDRLGMPSMQLLVKGT